MLQVAANAAEAAQQGQQAQQQFFLQFLSRRQLENGEMRMRVTTITRRCGHIYLEKSIP